MLQILRLLNSLPIYIVFGHPDAKVTIGKMSGIPTVEIYFNQLGLNPNEGQKLETVKAIKKKAF